MALTKITTADTANKGVTGLEDTPALSTLAMQEKFDELSVDVIIPKHNTMIDELASVTSGKGADAVGFDKGASGLVSATAGDAIRELKGGVDEKADTSNVLTRDNTSAFTPDSNYEPATKKYVDDTLVAIGAGDMAKAIYDTNNDGVVNVADNAYMLGAQLPAYYAQSPKTFTATVTTTWTGSAAPYTQTVAVSGLLAIDRPHVAPVYSATNATAIAQREAWACVSKAEAGADAIIFTCFEDKPETAIPIQIEVMR